MSDRRALIIASMLFILNGGIMRKVILGLIGLAFTNVCMGGNDQVYNVNIKSISAYDTHAVFYFEQSFTHTQNCTPALTDRAVIRFDNDENKEMFSAGLSAAMAGKVVNLGLKNCDDTSGFPKAYRMDVKF